MENEREIADEVLRRVKQLDERDKARAATHGKRLTVVAVAVGLVLVVGLAFMLPAVSEGYAFENANAAGASLLAGAGAGGYALMGVVGYTLGTVITLFAVKGRKRG